MDITLDITDDVALIRFDDGKKNAFTGIGHTSWLLAQRPSMGVMLNTQGCPWRDRTSQPTTSGCTPV